MGASTRGPPTGGLVSGQLASVTCQEILQAKQKEEMKEEGKEAKGRRRSLCEETYTKQVNVMLAEKNYAAAADLQAKMDEDIKEAEAQALLTGHEGAESVGARKAAAVDARARHRAEVEEQYAPKIDTMLAAKDYAAAARLQEEMEARIKDEEAGARLPSAAGHGRSAEAKADAVSACRAMAARRRAELEETYAPLIAAMLAQKKYAAAADIQAKLDKEIKEAEAQALLIGHEGAESVGAREAAAVAARARHRAEVEEQYAPKIDMRLAAKDYAAAARLQEEMETRIKDEEAGARLPSAAGHGRSAEAKADAVGACRAMAARRRAECEATYAPLIAALLAGKKYAAAADLQAKMDKEIKDAVIAGHEGAESVGAREAAAVAARARRRAEVEEQYTPKIDAMLVAKDYASAARLQEEMETRIKGEEAGARLPSAAGHGRSEEAKADAVGVCHAMVARCQAEGEERYAPLINALLAEKKYAQAADLQAKLDKEIKEAEAKARIAGYEGAESVGAREAAAVAARSRCRAEVEEQYTPRIDAMLAAKDYAAAARLQEEMETRIKDEEAGVRLPSAAGHGRSAEAKVDALGVCRAMAARCRSECEEKYAPLINAVLAEKKYAQAADLQARLDKEIKEAEARAFIAGHEGTGSVGAREAAAVDARAHRRAEVEEQYAPKLDALLAAKDYAAAARLQEEMEMRIKDEEAGARLSSAAGHGRTAEAKARRRAEYERQIAAMVAAKNYTAAAALQSELNDGEVSLGGGAGTTPAHGTPSISGDGRITIKEVCEAEFVQHKRVRLERVRVLSIGKPEQRKGKGKSRGRAQGQGRGKGANKGAGKENLQVSQVVYFGDEEGYIVCTLASGENIQRVPPASALNGLATVSALKPRPGNKGVLYWTEDTKVSVQLEGVDLGGPPVFPYDVCVSPYFATMAFAGEVKLGEHIALVFKALAVETRYTYDSNEAYLEVQGVDIEGAPTGALRFWRFEEGDIAEGRGYIARGLKVAAERRWDDELNKYVCRDDGTRRMECTGRTAVEDVSHVAAIMTFFS